MTREERVNFVKKMLWPLSIAPGLIMLCLYKAITSLPPFSSISFSLIKSKDTLSPIIAGYAITSLAFILAIIAFSTTLPKNYKVRRYNGWGFYDAYIKMVKIDILYLMITMILSILLLSNFAYPHYILNATMVLFVNTLIMSCLSIHILLNLMKTSSITESD